MKRMEALLMQYLSPPDSAGPSSNTCPRWESPSWLRTSMRFMPWLLSSCCVMASGSTGFVKLGQPQPESNLSAEVKSGSPVTTVSYTHLTLPTN